MADERSLTDLTAVELVGEALTRVAEADALTEALVTPNATIRTVHGTLGAEQAALLVENLRATSLTIAACALARTWADPSPDWGGSDPDDGLYWPAQPTGVTPPKEA